MNDYTWDQMSVMERCEVLRARVQAVEAEIKALKASWAPAEFVSLRDRVRELEGGRIRPNVWDRLAEKLDAVTEAELARLRRIEEAARHVHAVWTMGRLGRPSVGSVAMEELNDALEDCK